MANLRMDMESTRELTHLLRSLYESLNHEVQVVDHAANYLYSNTEVPAVHTLIEQIKRSLSATRVLRDEGTDLRIKLETIIESWENKDSEGAANFQGIGTSVPLSARPSVAPASSSSSRATASSSQSTASDAGQSTEGSVSTEGVTEGAAPAETPVGSEAGLIAVQTDEGRVLYSSEDWESRLAEAQKNGNVEAVLNSGYADDGPGPLHSAFPEGQCTWFASSRRNLSMAIRGHAKFWADQAAGDGYDVGQVPVKGSIMVWQPGVHGADERFGHVSFVERVVPLDDGRFKVYYTDNDFRDPSLPSSAIIDPEQVGVDFIYDKKA